jgi:putative FmdB family regulatory protein
MSHELGLAVATPLHYFLYSASCNLRYDDRHQSEGKEPKPMPIYEYSCGKCDKEFELLVRSANDKGVCPHCGSQKLTKKFSVFASSSTASSSGSSPSIGACGMPRTGGCGCSGPHHHH